MKMKFERWKEKQRKDWEEFKDIYISLGILSLIIFIVTMTYYISTTDFIPATSENYSPLYDQVDLLEKDINNLFSMDNATLDSSIKNITLSSEECDLCLTLDNKVNITSIKEIDNCHSPIFIIPIIFCSLFLSFCGSWVLLICFFIIGTTIEFIKDKLKKK